MVGILAFADPGERAVLERSRKRRWVACLGKSDGSFDYLNDKRASAFANCGGEFQGTPLDLPRDCMRMFSASVGIDATQFVQVDAARSATSLPTPAFRVRAGNHARSTRLQRRCFTKGESYDSENIVTCHSKRGDI